MPVYTATIKGVTSRTVTRKRDQKTITIYDIEDSSGKNPSTSRRDLANEAYRLVDHPADLQVRIEMNGTYENVYLEDIRAAQGRTQPQQDPFTERPPAQQEARYDTPQPQLPEPKITVEGEGTAKDWSIWRQCATKVAANMSQTSQEFWFNVRTLMTFYATGLEPELPQEQPKSSYVPAAQAQQAQSNQFIPDGLTEGGFEDPGPQYSREFSDDDIPF